jgi:hypothetical protein
MFTKEVKTEFRGHQIAARNVWGPAVSLKVMWTEMRLYIDGELADTASDAVSFNKEVAILRGKFDVDGRPHIVEIYAFSSWTVRMKICIDGEKVAGDLA